MAENEKTITAGMLAIGDELLSGRTADRNIAYLAEFLTQAGIDLREARIVPDEQEEIVAAINALSARYTYVFTSGGIGPTHDDITADAVAAAFNVSIGHHPKVMEMMRENYAARGIEFTPARQRMARIPDGAELIENAVSVAPGFRIGNVHVLAGVPSVFQAMLETVAAGLETGAKMLSRTLEFDLPEGTIGGPLAEIAKANPDVVIGSYPRFDGKTFATQIVVRGRDETAISRAAEAIETAFEEISRPA